MAVYIKLVTLLLNICLFIYLSTGDDTVTYDFIIVGGGLSGCVVAGRLSEKYSVLLLEAGGEPDHDSLNIPAKMVAQYGNPKYSKIYKSEPQTNAGLGTEGVINYLMGKTLGGGSSVNGMIWNRGSPHDYDHWANISGDPSWSYDSLMRYFKRVEDYRGLFPNDEEHGREGPVAIEASKYAPGLETWLEAGRSLGYTTADANGPQKIGFSPVEFTRKNGRRVSAYSGYLKPFLNSRKQLKVLANTTVTRILFDNEGDGIPRAAGVIYETSDGDLEIVRANKEVIVSAGTMDSAALLMRSGIGPEEVLEESGIEPVTHLPVGYNLQDHVFLKLDFLVDAEKAKVFDSEKDLTPESWKIFEETGDGPYASPNGVHGQAFLVSSKRKLEETPNPEWPDLQLFHLHSPAKLGLIPEESSEADAGQVKISAMVALVRPKSRGRITLNSSDVDAMPRVDFQYLEDPDDMEVLLEGVQFVLKLYEETPPFQQLGTHYSPVPYGPCTGHPFRSEDYWRCYIRHRAGSGIHAGGTCRLGKGEEDPEAVVDSTLKVVDVAGLRVVDLSVMPAVTNANTQAAAYVIAEKATDMILEEWEGTTEMWRKDEL